jgi:hypothetical protein
MATRLALRGDKINTGALVGAALEACMQIYRFLSGDDDVSFCHKVTKALSEGWELHGSPTYAYDGFTKKMRCGQAVTRVAKDQPYDPDKKLVDF